MSGDNWKYIKTLKNRSAVRDFLAENQVELPFKLVEILEEFNGGRPENKDFITSTGREYVFKSLLSYNEKDKETIYKVYPDLFMNTSLFPIGTDPAGNFICYDHKSKKYVLLNHETASTEDIMKMPFEV